MRTHLSSIKTRLSSSPRRALRLAPSVVAAVLAVAALGAEAHAAPRTAAAPLSPIARHEGRAWLWARETRPAPSAARLDARALELRARAALGALGVDTSRLVVVDDARFGDGDHVLELGAVFRGLPVVGHGAAVRLSASGEPIVVSARLDGAMPVTVSPTLTAGAAAIAAAPFSPVSVNARDAKLVVWAAGRGEPRLAYAVVPVIPAGMPTAPRVIVDAQTGAILEARDLVTFAKARVYKFNPVSTPTVENLDLLQTPTADKLSSAFITANNCIDNKTVKPVNFFGFNMNVHVCDLVQVATADVNGDFLYEPADTAGSAEAKKDAFSEVSIYFHTARAYEYFRGLAGDASAQVVRDKPIRVVANLQIPAGISSGNIAAAGNPDTPLEPFSNAFFSPANGGLGQLFQQLYGIREGGLWFGQGPNRDYAYDGDVVYHEFGHAVVDRTLGLGAWHLDAFGAVDAPGAMNEGMADYFAAAITGDSAVGEYASKDISQNLGAIRDLENQDKCPGALVGEVHFDSTLFSGALWSARKSLGDADKTKMDVGIYKAMRTSPAQASVGYDDIAKLFLATLKTDAPAAAAAVEKEMTARGVLPGCNRVVSYGDKAVKAPATGIGGFVAPGAQGLGLTGLAPGLLQFKLDLDGAKSGKVTVTFKSRASGGGGSPLGNQGTPYTPAVAAKFDAPIQWSYTPEAKSDAAAIVDAASSTASFDVPETAKSVYVQIVNKGDNDGAYDDVAISVEPRAVTAPPPGDGPPDEPQVRVTETSCGCTTPGTASTSWAGLGALALAAGAAARRRRRH